MRSSIAALVLLAGCTGGAEPVQRVAGSGSGAGAGAGEAEPPPRTPHDDPDAARKRACVRELLAGADPAVHGLLRSVCAEWVERKVPGIAIAIVEPGAAPFHRELGVRCYTEDAPVAVATPFRFGSVSKVVTAALALGLVDAGALGLETTAGGRISGWPGQAELPDPRLDALLQHRSGLGDVDPEHLGELDGAWLPALARSAPAGAPGQWHYSNSGYSVVGAMIEAASERDYAALVAERVAAPLGLPSFSARAREVEGAACGHLEYDIDRHPISVREDLDFMPGDPSWMDPAGGVLGSAVDLARFALAIGTDQLPGSAAMLEPGEPLPADHARATRPDERYGLGLRSWSVGAARAYGHAGNNVAFAAELMFVPGERAIVLLANCGTGLPASVAAAEKLLAAPR